jgi:hypothetical protein
MGMAGSPQMQGDSDFRATREYTAELRLYCDGRETEGRNPGSNRIGMA